MSQISRAIWVIRPSLGMYALKVLCKKEIHSLFLFIYFIRAAFAILSVNTIIAVYVYKAFTEEEDERPINTAGEESSLAAEEGSKTSADSVARNRPVSPDIKARRRNVQQ